jgi:hypothetical protein
MSNVSTLQMLREMAATFTMMADNLERDGNNIAILSRRKEQAELFAEQAPGVSPEDLESISQLFLELQRAHQENETFVRNIVEPVWTAYKFGETE